MKTKKREFCRFGNSEFGWKVEQRGRDECWPWLGVKSESGYGRFGDMRAHRAAWEIANNCEVPVGLFVCHSCDNRACCNPRHLWVGTHRQNMDDMKSKGRLKGRNQKGEANPRAVLCESQVAYIKLLLAHGFNNSEIGRWYGVTHGLISAIKRGKAWVGVEAAPLVLANYSPA